MKGGILMLRFLSFYLLLTSFCLGEHYKVGVLETRAGLATIDAKGNIEGGFAIDVWKGIAKRYGWSYSLESIQSEAIALQKFNHQEIDLLIGPCASCIKGGHYTSSHPFFLDEVGILTKEWHTNFWNTIETRFGHIIISLALFFFIACIITAHFLFLVERKNPELKKKTYIQNLGDFMWSCYISGCGIDIVYHPRTLKGIFVYFVWLLGAIIVLVTLTGLISASYTKSTLESTIVSVKDMHGKTFAVLDSNNQTTLRDVLKIYGARLKVYKTEDTAIEDVKKGHVSGLVGDVLSLIKIAEASNRLVLSQLTLKTKPLGFIVPAHSQLRSFVNKQLSDPYFEQALLSSCRKHFGMEGQKRCLV